MQQYRSIKLLHAPITTVTHYLHLVQNITCTYFEIVRQNCGTCILLWILYTSRIDFNAIKYFLCMKGITDTVNMPSVYNSVSKQITLTTLNDVAILL